MATNALRCFCGGVIADTINLLDARLARGGRPLVCGARDGRAVRQLGHVPALGVLGATLSLAFGKISRNLDAPAHRALVEAPEAG